MKLFRGQSKKYDKCLFVPSALRDIAQNFLVSLSGANGIAKVKRFVQDMGSNTNLYRKQCATIVKNGPFQNCTYGIPYIFWLSIVFCDRKLSHMGKNTSFSGDGIIPYPIDRDTGITDDNEGIKFNFDGAKSVEKYALKIVKYYFGHTPPSICDDFIRIYMEHQHYCPESCGYIPSLIHKEYKREDGVIIDGDNLPDHFTFLLDWTEDKCIAQNFAQKEGDEGTVVSIDSKKYDRFVGANYKMSYNDKITKHFLIDTAAPQKSVVTFWPWTFTIAELEKNELGHALGFSRVPQG